MAESRVITKLSAEQLQFITAVLPDGTNIYLNFYFNYNTNHWYLDVEYKNFIYNGIQIVYSDNLLRQFTRILPFGIQVDSKTGLSPLSINSFKDGLNRIIINIF